MTTVVFAVVLAMQQVHAVSAPVYRAPAPAVRAAAPPAMHAAPVVHPAPVMRPVPVMHPVPVVHPVPGMHPAPVIRPVPVVHPAARNYAPNGPYASGPYRAWRGPVIANPRHWRWWAWNRYVTWYPAPYYWGGGFWGPWSMLNPPVAYGAEPGFNDRVLYTSYEAAPYGPGAELLLDYGLAQTACGAPNLVVIWGPDNSVVCAVPNGVVGAGNYELDPATLTLRAL